MVILKGIVRSGNASTEDTDSYIANAEIIQLSSVVYTSSNGTFYTSALTLDIATCQASEYGTVQYSIPDFATIYDPAGVVSGSITVDADVLSTSGMTIMTDGSKIFLSGALTNRVLSMRSGVYDGCTGVVYRNTANTFTIGDAYAMSGSAPVGWSIAAKPPWFAPRSQASVLVTSSGYIFVANGYALSESYQADVWRSADGGSTWLKLNETPGWTERYNSYLWEDTSGNILMGFGSWDSDVWKSTDNGYTWTELVGETNWVDGWQPTMLMLTDGTLIISGEDDPITDHILQSTDYGSSWSLLCAHAGWSARYHHTLTRQSGNCIVCTGGEPDVFTSTWYNDVWRSTDKGATWTCMTSNASWTARAYHTVDCLSDNTLILIGGENKATVYFNDVWKSIDNGATWSAVTSSTVFSTISKHKTVVLSGDVLLIVSGETPTEWDMTASIFRSADKGSTWTKTTATSSGIYERFCLGMASAPNGHVIATGGYDLHGEDAGDVILTTDGGSSWSIKTTTPPWGFQQYPCVVSLPDNSFVFCAGYLNPAVYRSTDDGATWTLQTASPEYQPRASFPLHYWTSLPDGSIVMAGGYISYAIGYKNDVWRSTNQGKNWTCMTSNAQFRQITSHNIVSLSDNSILILGGFYWQAPTGYSKDVWRSTDLGANWTALTSSVDFLSMGMESVVVLPNDKLVMATYNSGNIYESVDKGVTWTLVDSFNGSNEGSFGFAYISGDGLLVYGGVDYHGCANAFVYKKLDNPGTVSSFCVIAATSGDIYNIGGISGESTTNIVFTLWDNKGYGRGRTR